MSDPASRTLLAVFAHPDDEVGAAGTLLAQRARGDRVVVVWLTRGEMTGAFGDLERDEVARRRTELGREAAGILGVEYRFMDFPDTRLAATPEGAREVARAMAEIRPDGLLTWGRSWVRGLRHPDHRATGELARDAITLARIARVTEPHPPHREPVPVFTYRGTHSRLPWAAVDVEPHLQTIRRVARHYREALGFGDPGWIERRLRSAGVVAGVEHAEIFDAWESAPGLHSTLLPADPGTTNLHPDRDEVLGSGAEDG
jgi:LmbE family N-acetylglucosaminyl deacetylase